MGTVRILALAATLIWLPGVVVQPPMAGMLEVVETFNYKLVPVGSSQHRLEVVAGLSWRVVVLVVQVEAWTLLVQVVG